jgi:RimJ/RimL family protein N-acetyltransferase
MLAQVPSVADAPAYPILRSDRAREPYVIRPYVAADREALESFYVEFEPKRAAQGLPPQGEERIRRWLNTVLGAGLHLVVYRDSCLIGHALLVPTSMEGTAEYAVFLRATDRGRGVGTELNRTAVEAARAAGTRRLWLTVAPHNRAAIRSYENAGFRFRPGTIYSPEAEMELAL